MKVIILTTSVYGTAGHHLPFILRCPGVEVAAVVVSEGQIPAKKNYYRKKITKLLSIGIGGAINGIRMRKWYSNAAKHVPIPNIEETCRQHNINFHRVPYTNSNETLEIFKQYGADVGLSLGNGYIAARIFETPKYGMLNIHHEILPQYQNAQSIIWQLYNGSAETGYTIHKINRQIDKGEIMLQEKIPILFKETLAETVACNYAQLLEHSARGLVKILSDFDNYYTHATVQKNGSHYTTPSIWQYFRILSRYNKLKKSRRQGGH